MSKTRLYVIRHGKTMFNTIGRAQGWSDTPLTAKAHQQYCSFGHLRPPILHPHHEAGWSVVGIYSPPLH